MWFGARSWLTTYAFGIAALDDSFAGLAPAQRPCGALLEKQDWVLEAAVRTVESVEEESKLDHSRSLISDRIREPGIEGPWVVCEGLLR
jgi:hypothetical protein